MKKLFVSLICIACGLYASNAQSFDECFNGENLRLDYVFCGDVTHQAIYFREAFRGGKWAGRRSGLGSPALLGNGEVKVIDPESGTVLYANSFSTLFQEWQATEEAAHLQKAFEYSIQVPFPLKPVDIEIILRDTHNAVSSRIIHRIDPGDILIAPIAENSYETREITPGASLQEAIDIVVVSEGYAASDRDKFFHDASRASEALFSHEPFKTYRESFAVRAVFAPSAQSGVSVPGKGEWKNTAVHSHFDTFYTDRYLTTSSIWKVWDIIGTVPFEHVIVLANTAKYGGGGIYNSITIMNSDHPTFVPVLVHEFGHAFGGLADEYAYGDNAETFYPADTEPWEPNLTTLKDFGSKWADLLTPGTPIPTPLDKVERDNDVRRIWRRLSASQKASLNGKVGVYEGGGYQSTGVYRPVQECRMRINECEDFCPVCYRSLVRLIEFYTK